MKINIKNWTIKGKLAGTMVFVVVVITGLTVYFIRGFYELRDLQDEGAKRAADAQLLMQVNTDIADLYQVFADAIINSNFEENRKLFDKEAENAKKNIETVNKLVDTDFEKDQAKDFEKEYVAYVKKYDELIGLLKRTGGEVTEEVRKLDGSIDLARETAVEHIITISDSLAKESKGADAHFDEIISSTIRIALFILAVSIGVLIGFAYFLISSISGGINNILVQLKNLIGDVLNGKLDSRGDVAKAEVDFKVIVDQTNQLIEAFVEPINVTAKYVSRISVGDIPEKITKEYKGDFNIIKNNLHSLIDAMNDVTGIMVEIGNGVFNRKGKVRSEHDQLIPSINNVIDTLNAITANINQYIDYTQKGEIEKINFDAVKFQGVYRAMVEGLNKAAHETVTPLLEVLGIFQLLAEGDLTKKVEGNYQGGFDALKQSVNRVNMNLTEFATSVQGSAAQVASGSEEMSASAQEMSQSATEQAASVEEVSSSMEEMSSSVTQNADNARETAVIAEKAAKDAKEGGKSVVETVTAMKSIAEKISVIEDIARQTNMLALNAAIEAARAGEHGKGFAVVADEVRNLAARSGNAAREISELSSTSVQIAEKAGQLIENIVPQIQKTAELVQEINASSSEQANGIEQVTQTVTQLDKAIQQNTSATEQMASTSEELSSQAVELQKIAAFFRVSKAEGGTGMARAPQARNAGGKNKQHFTGVHVMGKDGLAKKGPGVNLDMSTDEDEHFERF